MIDDLALTIRTQPVSDDGSVRLDLLQGERSVSHVDRIAPFVLQIGAARVRMDGIVGLGTDPECRRQGYAGRVMNAAIDHMRAGDASLSMLYGIRDYYPRFGYATAGPEHYIRLTQQASSYPLPAGWSVRPVAAADIASIQKLYARMTERSVGSAVRSPTGAVWSKLSKFASSEVIPHGTAQTIDGEECRVVIAPSGQVSGYVWRSDSFWYVRHLSRYYAPPGSLVLAEVAASDREAAVAVLAACRFWAEEDREQAPARSVVLPIPPNDPIAGAARFQSAEFTQGYSRCGASMVLVLDASRLLHSLLPELNIRWRKARLDYTGQVAMDVDDKSTLLKLDAYCVGIGGPSDSHDGPANDDIAINLPGESLGRLALGAYPPDELLANLPNPPTDEVRQIICVLFPERHPHMYLPDRF